MAIVDCLTFGGTCALRGCDPKKALWSIAQAFDTLQNLQAVQAGIKAASMSLDWGQMMTFKRRFTELVPLKREAQFHERGLDALHGVARFTGPNTVTVDNQQLKGRHMLIATGAQARALPFEGTDHLVSSDKFLALERLPSPW